MAVKSLLEKTAAFLKKYKYAALILTIGLALMLIPMNAEEKVSEAKASTYKLEVEFEDRLASVLSCVEGAGEVQVILTQQYGEETLYQTNEDSANDGSNVTVRTDTVTVTDAERNETGLIKQVVPATYRGAIILCQGADNPSVRYDIINAVSRLIGIGTHCITVLKMK
ncbi:MAG: hypothetical protein IKJ94_04620 [Oscillospiraceae bacterium]|nr:hypothetical protein [Oscillospiraceae bacterium]